MVSGEKATWRACIQSANISWSLESDFEDLVPHPKSQCPIASNVSTRRSQLARTHQINKTPIKQKTENDYGDSPNTIDVGSRNTGKVTEGEMIIHEIIDRTMDTQMQTWSLELTLKICWNVPDYGADPVRLRIISAGPNFNVPYFSANSKIRVKKVPLTRLAEIETFFGNTAAGYKFVRKPTELNQTKGNLSSDTT